MWKDPIVEEIRQIRLEIEAECHHDFEEMFRQATQAQEAFSRRNQIKDSDSATMRVSSEKRIDEESLRRLIREEVLLAIG
jgi:hypothetical protein